MPFSIKTSSDMRTVLEDAAPVFRKVWWDRHSLAHDGRPLRE
jgi:hypothetical protein